MSERISSRTEYQEVKAELNVHFRRFVGEKTGREDLKATPDFMRGETINPDWIASVRQKHTIVSTPSPGKLIFTKPGWKAARPDSPVGKIEKLQEQAKELLEQPENPTKKKKAEKNIRAELVEIFNSYAGERFKGIRDVVNGNKFGRITLNNFTSSSLRDWREKLVRTKYQASTPELFDRWTEPSKKLHSPSQADAFLTKTFREIASSEITSFNKKTTPPETLSNEASLLTKLLSQFDAQGYIAIANMFYGGDMLKAFQNLSAITWMTGAPFPEGWQQFNGSTSEFRQLENKLTQVTGGVEGYLKAADDCYGGDLLKAYMAFSAFTKITGAPFPEGWRQFQGSTTDFKKQREWVAKNTKGTVDMFMIHCKITSRVKARINLAAVRTMTS